eukprot:TRINITY_DN13485_c0_g1_i13.p1 TRINITY_DN13485_c0_g1~~TRINITY_DN13485_c0_g1_i13.p1  ORF type:complete len:416 (+),score=118.03 TRINITY_DN13485_c0_g1_i13:167-1414(+)
MCIRDRCPGVFTGDILGRTNIAHTVTDIRSRRQPLVQVSRNWLEIFEYEEHEVVGYNVDLLVGRHTDESTQDKCREAMRKLQEVSCTILNYSKSGTPIWNKFTLVPLWVDGKAVAYLGTHVLIPAIGHHAVESENGEVFKEPEEQLVGGVLIRQECEGPLLEALTASITEHSSMMDGENCLCSPDVSHQTSPRLNGINETETLGAPCLELDAAEQEQEGETIIDAGVVLPPNFQTEDMLVLAGLMKDLDVKKAFVGFPQLVSNDVNARDSLENISADYDIAQFNSGRDMTNMMQRVKLEAPEAEFIAMCTGFDPRAEKSVGIVREAIGNTGCYSALGPITVLDYDSSFSINGPPVTLISDEMSQLCDLCLQYGKPLFIKLDALQLGRDGLQHCSSSLCDLDTLCLLYTSPSPRDS